MQWDRRKEREIQKNQSTFQRPKKKTQEISAAKFRYIATKKKIEL